MPLKLPAPLVRKASHYLRAGGLLFLLSDPCAWGQTPATFSLALDAAVTAMAEQPDGKVWLGGQFTSIGGVPRNHLALLNPDGTLDPAFNPGADGFINALIRQPDGKLVAGGTFTNLAGQSCARLGRFNPGGSLDASFNPGVDGEIRCLALQADGKILLGGQFTTVASQPRNRLARLNSNGSLDLAFNPNAAGCNGAVNCVALQTNGQMIVGGDFTIIGGRAQGRICRLNPDGTMDTNFVAAASDLVHSLAVQGDGKILVGGLFNQINSTGRNNIARLNPDGTLDPGFTGSVSPPGTMADNYSIGLQSDGKILLGGTAIGWFAYPYFGRLNNDGTVDTNFTANVGSGVWSIGLQSDGSILNSTVYTLARITNTPVMDWLTFSNSTTLLWLRWGGGPEVWRTTFERSTDLTNWVSLGAGTRIGGGWQRTGVISNTAYIRARGFVSSGFYNASHWFVETFAGPVVMVTQPASRTNAAGTAAAFTVQAGGSTPLTYRWRKNGAALVDGGNVSGATAATLILSNLLRADAANYSVVVSNTFGAVTSAVATLTVLDPFIHTPPGDVAIDAGQTAQFSVGAAGTALTYRWLKNGAPLAGAATNSLTLTNVPLSDAGSLLRAVVSNSFGAVTSAPALLTVNGALADSLNPQANYQVHSLAIQPDGKIVMSGYFSFVSGQLRSGIARLNPEGDLDTNFVAGLLGIPFSTALPVVALQEDGKILIAGGISSLNGQGRSQIGRFNPDGSVDETFDPGASPEIFAMTVQADGKIVLGGSFTNLAGQACNRLGRLNRDGTLDHSFGASADGTVYSLAAQPDGKFLVGGLFATVGGQARTNLARLNPDGSPDAGFSAGANGAVKALAVQADGNILVGGSLTALGGQARTNLGRLGPTGALDSAFDPAPDGPVASLVVQTDGRIAVGGTFTRLAGQPRNSLGRLNADGSVDSSFNPNAVGGVDSIAIQPDGNVVVAGSFTSLNGQARGYVGRVSATSSPTQALSSSATVINWLRAGPSPEAGRVFFDISPDGSGWTRVEGARVPGGWQATGLNLQSNVALRARGFVAGSSDGSSWFFEQFSGRPFIAVPPTSRTNDANTTATFTVAANSILPLSYAWLKDGQPLADGGNLIGTASLTLTLSNVFGADAGGYSVVVSNTYGAVTSAVAVLAVRDPLIVLPPTNQFVTVGRPAQFSVTAIGTRPLGYQWLKDGSPVGGETNTSLALAAAQLSDAGNYQAVVSNRCGATTSVVAVLRLNMAVADAFDPAPDAEIYAFAAQPDGKVVVGGNFMMLGGTGRNRLGRLNADGSVDPDFNPGANSTIFSLTVQGDGKILVGGSFTTVAGQARNYLARLNPDGSLDTNFNASANGAVYSLALQDDGGIVAGGGFSLLDGQYHPRLGRLNSDGSLDSAFSPAADNVVRTIAVQPDKKILVGGYFTSLGGQTRNHIGRLNSDGTLDPIFDPNANDFVHCLALRPDGRIIVGGWFTAVGNTPRGAIAQLNPDGTVDPDYNPNADTLVYSIALQADGKLVAGGNFSTLGGQARSGIGRLNPDGSVDSSFFPVLNGNVYGVALQADGKILVSGGFSSLDGAPRSFFGRLGNNSPAIETMTFDGTTVTWQRGGSCPEIRRAGFDLLTNGNWWNLGSGAPVPGGWQLTGVAAPSNSTFRALGVVTGGFFNSSGGLVEAGAGPAVLFSQPVSRTNVAGTPAWFHVDVVGEAPTFSWRKDGLALADGPNISGSATPTLVFSQVFGADAGGYAFVVSNRFGAITSLVATLTVIDPAISSPPVSQSVPPGQPAQLSVSAVGTAPLSYRWLKDGQPLSGATDATLPFASVLTSDAGLYQAVVSNQFSSVTSSPAALTVNAVPPDSLDPAPGSPVFGFAAQPDGKLLLGGSFTAMAGQPRSYIARLNADGTLDPLFNPGAGYSVDCFAVQPDGKILVGGEFGSLGGQSRAGLGRLNPDGSLEAGFAPIPGGNVYALALQPDGKIIVGGWFTSLGGQTRYNVGRLNPNGSQDTSYNSSAGDWTSWVSCLALNADGTVLIGGRFGSAGGLARNNIARLNADGTADANFNPGANGDVYAVAVQPDGKILFGGQFTVAGGGVRNNLARLNPDGSLDSGFNPGADGGIYSIALQADGKIVLGGTFSVIGGLPRSRIARLNPDGRPDVTFDPGANSYVFSVGVMADGRILAGGYFLNLAGQQRYNFARLINNTPATQSLALNGSTLTWLRGGSSAEAGNVMFSASTNGAGWFSLGTGSRVPGGWQLSSASLPAGASVRARASLSGGYRDGSTWFADAFLGPPVIVNQPAGSTNNIATVASVAVAAEGTPSLLYRWRKNGLDLADAGNLSGAATATLVLSNVVPADSGDYTVVVSNDFGAVTSVVARIEVDDPRILTQPQSLTRNAGSAAAFTVAADGTPTLGYQWLKDGIPLTDAANLSGSATVTLTVSGVLHADAADYSVVVTNLYGAITSAVARLTVIDPVITGQPLSQTVNLGSNATFSVTAAGTSVGYQWLRNGAGVDGGTSASVTFTNAQAADAGSAWQVVVSNAFGSFTSAVAILSVNLALVDSLNPGANGTVYALAVQPDGRILAGGGFTTFGGQTRNRIARLNADGTLDLAFNPGANNSVYAITIQPDARILVGGAFFTLGGQPRYALARLNPDGSLDGAFNPGEMGRVYSLAWQADGKILVAGEGQPIRGDNNGPGVLDRFFADGTQDLPFDPRLDGPVYAVALQPDGRILLGGRFTTVNGQGHTNLARLNSDGSLDPSFNPVAGPAPTLQAGGMVSSLALQPDGRILVGGMFNTLNGQSRTNLGRLFPDGSLDQSFGASANSQVFCVVVQTDGRILLSGVFTSVAGQPRNRIARLNADGSLDVTFDPGANATTYALAIQADGGVLAGGGFSSLGGQARADIARLAATSPATQSLTLDPSTITWHRSGGPEVGRVTFETTTNGADWTALGEGSRIAGGWQITNAGVGSNATIRAHGFASGGRYAGSGSLVEASMGPPAISVQPIPAMASVVGPAATPVVFSVSAAGSTPLSYRWQKDGLPLFDSTEVLGTAAAVLTLLRPGLADAGGYSVVITNSYGSVTSVVAALTVQDFVIATQPTNQSVELGQAVTLNVAAGASTLGYQWLKNSVPVDGATNLSLQFPAVQGSDAGRYQVVVSSANAVLTSAVAVLSVNLAAADGFPPAISGTVYASAIQPDGKVLLAGMFTAVGGQTRNRIARLNADGTLDPGFNPGAGNTVYALAVQPDGRILVGGAFATLAGQACANFGRLNPDGSPDAAFNPAPNNTVYAIAQQADGKILVGGTFTSVAGQTWSRLARLNPDGSLDAAFNPAPNSTVQCLALQPDGRIIVGGTFYQLAGQTRYSMGRLNPDGSLDTSFTPQTYVAILSVAVQPDGKILVSGDGKGLNWQGRTGLGQLLPDGRLDRTFVPGDVLSVNSLALQADGRILLGGGFTSMAGLPRSYLARLEPDGGLDLNFSPAANALVNSLALQPDGGVVVGGNFTTLAGQTRNRMARLANPTAATQALSSAGPTLTWLRGGSSPEISRVNFEFATNGSTWTSLGPGARIPGGWQSGPVTVPPNANVRARGLATGGFHNGSEWVVESVIGPPIILGQPSPSTTTLGSPVTFSVYAGGTPALSYRWRKDGVALADDNSYTGTSTPNLIVTPWSPGNAAGYSVVVSNALGVVTSAIAVLTVPLPVPVLQATDGGFGYSNGTFGFNITGGTGLVAVIEASTNLVNWVPIQTNALLNGQVRINDRQAGAFAHRFYRARFLFAASASPAFDLSGAAPPAGLSQCGFGIAGLAGRTLVMEASADLVNWTPILTNTLTTGYFYFSEPASTLVPSRFFRARMQ